MSDRQAPGPTSIDIMIAGLEKSRRAGWAKFYEAEGKLAESVQTLGEARETISRLQETAKLCHFMTGVLRELAPSLSPWLSGADPGLQSFDGVQISPSDDRLENRWAGSREARIYLSLDERTREQRDWRARQVGEWYDDPEAKTPTCATCNCASWDHKGPRDPCLDCAECAAFVPRTQPGQ